MIKPKRLHPGDTVALVSPSSGMAGDAAYAHRAALGKRRLEQKFGLNVVVMPNAMRGAEALYRAPQARADDWMQAVRDPDIHGIVTMIGGDDTVRLLPYIDFDLLRDNPKVFMGYSDTTVNHFMMYKAGVTSFYGPCVLAEFAENNAMHDYTKRYVEQALFAAPEVLEISPSPRWTSALLDWADPANDDIARPMTQDTRGYELLQGSGAVQGRLLGGCVDVLPMIIGTALWPEAQNWRDTLLFLETSEEYPAPSTLRYLLRNFAAQGILQQLGGMLFGKPRDERYYQEYKEVLLQVVGDEAGRPDMPILYNMNFGHTAPICVLPYGAKAEIDCTDRAFKLLEAGVV